MTMKPEKMIRKLKQAGFIEISKTGGHRRFAHPDGRMTEVPRQRAEKRNTRSHFKTSWT